MEGIAGQNLGGIVKAKLAFEPIDNNHVQVGNKTTDTAFATNMAVAISIGIQSLHLHVTFCQVAQSTNLLHFQLLHRIDTAATCRGPACQMQSSDIYIYPQSQHVSCKQTAAGTGSMEHDVQLWVMLCCLQPTH